MCAPIGPAEAVVAFAGTVAISVAIGLATGFLAARIIGLVDDHLVELTISVVLAYGSYMLADAFHLSGVIATVTAAIVLGNVGPGRAMTATGADAIDTVWEFFAYLLTAVVFLLVGLAIPPGRLLDSLGPIAWGIVGILVGRALVVYVLLGGASRLARRPGLAEPVPSGWLHVLFWAGLRGAVAVAMALSLPADIPQRALLQEITFGVVLFTLLVQGTTVGRVVDRTIGGDDRDRRAPASRPRRLATAEQPSALGRRGLGRHFRRPLVAQDLVDLLAVVPADRGAIEPLDVLEVRPGDLAQRPAGVPTEVQDRARRPARAAGLRPRSRRPSASTPRIRRPASSGPRSSRATPSRAGGGPGRRPRAGRRRAAPPWTPRRRRPPTRRRSRLAVAAARIGPARRGAGVVLSSRALSVERLRASPARRSAPTPR